MDTLGDDTFTPSFLYLDSDLIQLFYNIKNNFYIYNKTAYINALQDTDNLLHIKNLFTLELSPTPVMPDVTNNFDVFKPFDTDKKFELNENNVENKEILKNSYENYQIATDLVKSVMNEIESMIISIPVNEATHFAFKQSVDKLYILLKRNLDFIYKTYNKHKKIYNLPITDYDIQVPINQATGLTGINDNSMTSNFNFY
jgi:hypothetical protein